MQLHASKTVQDPSGLSHLLTLTHLTAPQDNLPATPTREQLLTHAESLREQANTLFAQAKQDFKCFKKAALFYNRALDAVRLAGGDPSLQIKLRNNLALCALRTAEWTAAIVQCDAVLEVDPRNGKALYRRALANVELDMFVRALQDLRTAHALCPHDPVVKKELDRVDMESKKTLQKRRQQFAETYNSMPQSPIFASVIP